MSEATQDNERFCWLHVTDDGTEQRFTEPPPSKPCTRVEVYDCYEQRITYKVRRFCDDAIQLLVPIPRGRGWRVVFDNDELAIWQRPS